LRAREFVYSKYFKELRVKVGEGGFKPVDAVEQEGEMLRRVNGLLD
jgi:hypothetical protein